MSFFVLTSYLTAFASIVFGTFVYFRNKRGTVNKIFLLLALLVALWGIGIANEVTSTSSKAALLWLRVFHIGVCLIPVAFFHFSLCVLDIVKRNKRLIFLGYLISGFFILLIPFKIFIVGVHPVIQFPFYLKPGFFYHIFMLYFAGFPAIAEWKLLQGARQLKGNKGKQATYVFIAGLIGFLGGLTTYLPAYDIRIYPWMNGFVFLYVFTLAISVLRHQLMDIEVIIRKTLVFAGLFSFAFGIFAFVTFLTQEVLSAYVTGTAGKLLSLFVSVFLIVLGYDPLRRFLINLTDQFLFQKKYDYRKLLRDASAGISQIKSLNQLLSLVTHFVTMRIRVKSAAILIHDEKNNYFRFAYSRGYPKEGWLRQGHIFNVNDPLIGYLADEHAPLDIERVKEWAEAGGPKQKKGNAWHHYDFKIIQARMEELQAACCVPSFLGENLRNILILGEKKSGDFYTDEDLNVLFTLAQESAIAIENARLYDQAIEKAKELEGINEQLNTAQSNLLHALNETEVANKKLRDTHAQLIHEQKMATLGRLASSVGHEVNNPLTILSMNVSRAILKHRSNPDLKVREILDIFQKMEQNISRIKAVVNTLTGLLKKSEHGKFEPLSLKLVLEETLPLVQFQTYLENLSGTEVNFDIPSNTPLIKGDLERLQEVFLNLFINAYHAMAGRRDRKITVTAHESPAHPAMVMIEFSDNGAGMTDEVMKKAFSYGFTTKPTGRGSGMGLYMCRYIIELHGGEIKVRSKLGEGTSFVITLPIHFEPTSVETGESAEL